MSDAVQTDPPEAPGPDEATAATEGAATVTTDAPAAAEETTTPDVPASLDRAPAPGDVVAGTVARLVDFGAFIDIAYGDDQSITGLVHVSEIDAGFVENIYAHLSVGDTVAVKVLSIGDDGKIGLSIKQADPDWDANARDDRPRRSTIDKDFDRMLRKFMHGSQSIQGEVRRQKRARLGIKKR